MQVLVHLGEKYWLIASRIHSATFRLTYVLKTLRILVLLKSLYDSLQSGLVLEKVGLVQVVSALA
jgi:hypothetical protein